MGGTPNVNLLTSPVHWTLEFRLTSPALPPANHGKISSTSSSYIPGHPSRFVVGMEPDPSKDGRSGSSGPTGVGRKTGPLPRRRQRHDLPVNYLAPLPPDGTLTLTAAEKGYTSRPPDPTQGGPQSDDKTRRDNLGSSRKSSPCHPKTDRVPRSEEWDGKG